jgi:hypothetical protein
MAESIIFTDKESLGYVVMRTSPDKLLRHDISDEELDMLCQSRRENLDGGMWAALGTVAGSLPGAVSGIINYFIAKLSLAELIQLILCSIGIALAITFYCLATGRGKLGHNLKELIRKRTAKAASG